ncbi:glycosyl transferases group 1 family protein [Mycobacterium xenopi 4042]|uniref:Glycosyl transferases group 1 family protein n=1 Tax=Mycobacterium xenopi 4042 TaxID=1299334 RepID=X7ZXD9_MYCXE|nr:glycosyl transferases group 1 family protein [Mycobacterium xenopi 4042]
MPVAAGPAQGSGRPDPGAAVDPPAGRRRGAGHRRRRPYLSALRRLAQRYRVTEHVVFTGAVSGAELPAHHAMADVFAMPCRTRGAGLDVEGLGIVFLEASATGVPVVAGCSGGAPETVQHNTTGLIVDGRSVDKVADAVGGLLADPGRAAVMGAAGGTG